MKVIAALAASLLLMSACGSSDYRNALEVAVKEGAVSRSFEGTIEVEVKGPALTANFAAANPLRIVTVVGSALPKSGWLLSVGTDNLLDVGGGTQVKPAFDLVGYRGKGSYKVSQPKAGGLTEEQLEGEKEGDDLVKGAQQSDSFIVVKRGDEVVNYNVIVRPCSLRLGDMGYVGTMTCPALSNGKDELSVTWSWKADPSKIRDDSTVSSLPGAAPSTTEPTTVTSSTTKEPSLTTTSMPSASTTDGGIPEQPVVKSDVKLNVRIDPLCAERGDRVAVRVETIPDAAVSLALTFAARQQGQFYDTGRSDADGWYRWGFIVPPTVEYGRAAVMVTVSSSDNQHGGGGMVPFEVKERC